MHNDPAEYFTKFLNLKNKNVHNTSNNQIMKLQRESGFLHYKDKNYLIRDYVSGGRIIFYFKFGKDSYRYDYKYGKYFTYIGTVKTELALPFIYDLLPSLHSKSTLPLEEILIATQRIQNSMIFL